jgi:hypothetical protein
MLLKCKGWVGGKSKIVLVSITNDNLLIDKLLIHQLLLGEVMIVKGMTNKAAADPAR